MLKDELNNLGRIVAEGGTAVEIDDALLPLISHSDPCIISPILALLNENGDQDGMWSILHTAESFQGAAYVTGLLTALPVLTETCPWWAQTLIIRLLNSDTYAAEFAFQLPDAPARMKQAVATICEKLSEDPRFHAKTVPILAAIQR